LAGGIGFTALDTDPNLPLLEFPMVLDDPYGSAGEHIPACLFDAFQQQVKGEIPFRRQPHMQAVNIGKTMALLYIEPDPDALQRLLVVESEGKFVSIDHLHPR
jgi:hypothetical protein